MITKTSWTLLLVAAAITACSRKVPRPPEPPRRATKAEPTATPKTARRARQPPRRPPAFKLWDCKVPPAQPTAFVGAAANRFAKPQPPTAYKPARVDFTLWHQGKLHWYRVEAGRITLVERITLRLPKGFSPRFKWRNADVLVVYAGAPWRLYELRFRDGGGRKSLPAKGRRYRQGKLRRFKRLPLPPLADQGHERLQIGPGGSVWLERCTKYMTEDGCQARVWGRLLPSFKKSTQPVATHPLPWQLKAPPGYAVKISRARSANACITCYRNGRPWGMYPDADKGRSYTDGMRWLGRGAPFFAVTHVKSEMVESHRMTNLFEACRGYPVGWNVTLHYGPKPFVAYKNEYLNRVTDTVFVRYDGHRIGKLRLPGHSGFSWRPLP